MWTDSYYGVCYYPEHWDPKRHESDIRRMAEVGFDIIRLGESAWAYFEPREGQFQFDIFDRVIDLCRKHGLKVVMGTPTYCAPAWVAHTYPEVLRWNFNRIPMAHGSRRNFTYCSPKYNELSDRICTALAEHYKGEKQIIGWQLDNEFNCHMDVSYAPCDTLAFRQWLRAKYRTLDRLNDAWGTAFWSQTYDDWDQIDLPHPTATYLNPSVLLDESRFISDTVVWFAKRQADILRKASKHWQITHNGLFANINGPDLAGALDFYSHDQYPLFNGEGDWPGYGWGLQVARSLSFPFAIMEQQSGPGGQMEYLLRTPRPGQMRLWTWQSYAHGAKSVLHFRWRTCPYGQEQHWHGLLDYDDRDNRRVAEAKQIAAEVKKLPAAFHDAPLTRAAAILKDYDNETNDRRINTYTREGRGEAWAGVLGRAHVPVDVAWPEGDWRGYKLLVAGHLKIVDRALATKLTEYVEAGGTLVLGAQAGTKDRNCHMVEQPMPGLLRKLAGVEVDDWTTLPSGQTREAKLDDGPMVPMHVFVERLRPRGATVVARWTGDDRLLADAPAVTVKKVGKGRVYYVGGYLPAAGVAAVVERVRAELDLRPLAEASGDVEVIERKGKGGRWLCLMNHVSTPQQVTGLPRGVDLITGRRVDDGRLELGAYEVAVLAAR